MTPLHRNLTESLRVHGVHYTRQISQHVARNDLGVQRAESACGRERIVSVRSDECSPPGRERLAQDIRLPDNPSDNPVKVGPSRFYTSLKR